MAKRVFFSFDFRDVQSFRANVVRNHWRFKLDRESAGFYDASVWEKARKQGDVAIKRLINGGLRNTSNTCVLIGSSTYSRRWVRYEILKSMKDGNHIFGVHINKIKDRNGNIKKRGYNPFNYLGLYFSLSGRTLTMLEYENGDWHEYYEIGGTASYRVDVLNKNKGKSFLLSDVFPTFDWVYDNGYENFKSWVK